MPKQTKIISAFNYSGRLFNFIRKRVKNYEDAEDILQDVWYQFISIIDVEPIEHIKSWLYRVSVNRIIDKKRKHKTLSVEDFIYEDEDGGVYFLDELLIDDSSPYKELERAQYKDVLYKALEALPEKQRNVFILNEIEGMTLQEIADKTEESLKTIISRKRYAIEKLKNLLSDYYDDLIS